MRSSVTETNKAEVYPSMLKSGRGARALSRKSFLFANQFTKASRYLNGPLSSINFPRRVFVVMTQGGRGRKGSLSLSSNPSQFYELPTFPLRRFSPNNSFPRLKSRGFDRDSSTNSSRIDHDEIDTRSFSYFPLDLKYICRDWLIFLLLVRVLYT